MCTVYAICDAPCWCVGQRNPQNRVSPYSEIITYVSHYLWLFILLKSGLLSLKFV